MEYKTIKPGDIIVSSPYANNGLVFSKSVIYIISHDKNGTSGVIVNKLLNNIESDIILKSLQIPLEKEEPKNFNISASLPVYFGGPIEQEKGIILHTSDYKGTPLVKINSEIYISADGKIIADIASGKGPANKILILGYASWLTGQLIAEIKRSDWLLLLDQSTETHPEEILKLLFSEDNHYKWNQALKMAGVNLSNFSNISGNA